MASARAEKRRTLLVATATDIGRRLFDLRRGELLGEGRILAGGWPGTLREARGLVSAVLAPVLAEHRMSAPTDEELSLVMHAANCEARRTWLTSTDLREDPES